MLLISNGLAWLPMLVLKKYYMKPLLKVTNHMVGGEGGNPKPALGESWKSIPHVRLLLSRDCGSNICNVSILKHPSVVTFVYSFISLIVYLHQ